MLMTSRELPANRNWGLVFHNESRQDCGRLLAHFPAVYIRLTSVAPVLSNSCIDKWSTDKSSVPVSPMSYSDQSNR